MSVLVEIYRKPGPVRKETKVLSINAYFDGLLVDQDFLKSSIDLNELVEGNKGFTFYAMVKGGHKGSRYKEGDVLVVDRQWPLQDNRLAVCWVDEKFQLMRIKLREDGIWLESLIDSAFAFLLGGEEQWEVWGIVTYEIKRAW